MILVHLEREGRGKRGISEQKDRSIGGEDKSARHIEIYTCDHYKFSIASKVHLLTIIIDDCDVNTVLCDDNSTHAGTTETTYEPLITLNN